MRDPMETARLLELAAEEVMNAVIWWHSRAVYAEHIGEHDDAVERHARAESDKLLAADLRALAAELAATPPAPWLPAPDGPGEWDAGAPGQDAVTLDTYRSAATLWATLPSGATVEVARWIADHPTWRYRRRPTVIVPAEEPAP